MILYSGISSTTAGTSSVATTRALTRPAHRGRSTDRTKPPVVATIICTAHDPTATRTVFRKERPMWSDGQAWLILRRVAPLGNQASGDARMSRVGVNAN